MASAASVGLRARLMLQGFACDYDTSIIASERWLRFTPVVSTLCIATGTALRSPMVLWAFSIIAAMGAAGWHPFDALFNTAMRRWVGAMRLPPNPVPRRFAMAVAAAWSAGVGWLFAEGFGVAGVVAGAALVIAAVLVATTHFCLGSWLYYFLRNRRVW